MPDELKEQVPLIKEVLAAMGIGIISKASFEADDILGTISRIAIRDGKDAVAQVALLAFHPVNDLVGVVLDVHASTLSFRFVSEP